MNQLNEDLTEGDLDGLVNSIVRVDKHKSKVGDDRDIIVIAFYVKTKNASEDMVSFLERGYTEIIDADNVSSENIDGDFVVFVESERSEEFPTMFQEVLDGLERLTSVENFSFKHYKSEKTLNYQELISRIPLNAEEYDLFMARQQSMLKELEQLKINARIPFK